MPRTSIEVYCTPEQKALLTQKAASSNKKLSAYALEVLLNDDAGLVESLKRIERLCAAAVASAIVSTSPSNTTAEANRDRAIELIGRSVRSIHRVIQTLDSVDPASATSPQR